MLGHTHTLSLSLHTHTPVHFSVFSCTMGVWKMAYWFLAISRYSSYTPTHIHTHTERHTHVTLYRPSPGARPEHTHADTHTAAHYTSQAISRY